MLGVEATVRYSRIALQCLVISTCDAFRHTSRENGAEKTVFPNLADRCVNRSKLQFLFTSKIVLRFLE